MPLKYQLGGICRNGHLLDEANLYMKPGDGSRNCRICRAAASKKDYAENRERRNETRRLWVSKNIDKRAEQARRSHLKQKFGLTQEEYQQLFDKQQGKCAICGEVNKNYVDSMGRVRPSLYIDHDHTTNAVRALLCKSCNTGLGYFYDNPELLRKAADYIDDKAIRHIDWPSTLQAIGFEED